MGIAAGRAAGTGEACCRRRGWDRRSLLPEARVGIAAGRAAGTGAGCHARGWDERRLLPGRDWGNLPGGWWDPGPVELLPGTRGWRSLPLGGRASTVEIAAGWAAGR
ncbi:hypothetical protein GCM10017566_69280 [Amycolatopsis bartoniae]|uniref:Uncharacterized protein n=1 Tax=Amycolatopsis bartoniae TaxID=941986 RepID=A0A8H9J0B1_9PSEU|nr:hypothetical protein GCM10017566_69280 [Amycolatopsis bartoniae]